MLYFQALVGYSQSVLSNSDNAIHDHELQYAAMKNIAQSLQTCRNQNRYRRREIMSSPQGAHIALENLPYLSFCSNDYLGLANDERVKGAMIEGIKEYGAGSGAAHLITGHFEPHHRLEEALAAHTGRSRALLFSTGYMANMGVIDALSARGDLVLEDKLNHASLIDGGLYSRGTFKRYKHADLNDLEKRLQDSEDNNRLIVTDGVFSMDGDIAPLKEITELATKYDAQVLVDDAHGLGALGETGGGVCELFSLNDDDSPIIMGTLGKSFGVFGAFIAGSDELIEWLIQRARTYVYTTALPPAMATAALASLQIIQTEPQRRQHLQALIERFRARVTEMGLELMPSQTPIQPIVVGDEAKALAWSEQLKKSGILVKAIRPPTVPEGTSRLRITFSAAHSFEDLEKLLSELEQFA